MAKVRLKYRNIPTVVDGIRFASKREAKRYSELKLMEKAGEILGLECQPRFKLIVNSRPIATYVADFTYRFRNGLTIVEDVKGVKTAVYSLKKKLMLAIYGIAIREV